MPVTLGTLTVLDGNGNPQTIQALDQSGVSTGPFTWGHVVIDGLLGVNRAQVTGANALKVDGSGVTQPVLTKRSTSSNQSNVISTTTSVTILASNSSRLGATVYNESTQVMYVLLGSVTASNGTYTVQVGNGGYYEVPFNYTGQINGLWASANGTARVTELT